MSKTLEREVVNDKTAVASSTFVYMSQLDSLRWWLFSVVFFSHALHAISRYPTLAVAAHHCMLGFFVLSGFLITRVLLNSETGDLKHDLSTFYMRRVLRIFPLYYLTLIALTLFAHLAHAQWHFTYLYNIKTFMIGHWDGCASHFWSLCVEEQFYLLFPIVLLLTPKPKRLVLLSILITTSLLLQLLCDSIWDAPRSFLLLPISGQCLLWGSLAGFIDLNFPLFIEPQTLIMGGLSLESVALAVDCTRHLGSKPDLMIMTAAGMAAVVLGLWRTQSQSLLKALRNPATVYLGKISYGLYIFHLPVLFFMPPQLRLAYVPCSLIVTVILSALSWRFFEGPINNLKQKIPYGRQKPAIESSEPAATRR